MMKIFEIAHWIAAALMATATVCSLAFPARLPYFVGIEGKECCGAELSVYGFEVNAAFTEGEVDKVTFFLFGIGAVLLLSLVALISGNLWRVLRSAERTTPFTKKNLRRLKEIGVMFILMPLVSLVMSTVIRLVIGGEAAEIRSSFDGFVVGIIVLSLTHFFARGVELEDDVDGLL